MTTPLLETPALAASPDGEPPRIHPGELKSRVINGIAWAGATRLTGQMLNWAMTLIVIRLLAPADYGLMAITMAVVGFLQSMSYAGFQDAVVHARNLDRRGQREAFGIIVLLHVVLIVLLWIAAVPVARFYGQPRLTLLLFVASINLVFLAVSAMPRAKLQQALALKYTSRVELIANLASGVTVLVLAFFGAGVWALMMGAIVSLGMQTIGYVWLSPIRDWPIFTLRPNPQLLRFGWTRLGENMVWALSGSSDVFIAGRLLGAGNLSFYTVARTIASLPVDRVANVIKPMSFPAFVHMQDDRGAAFSALCRAVRLLGFAGFPIFLGLAAVAPEVVSVILGQKWERLTVPLMLLAIAMVTRPVSLLVPSFLAALGEVRASFENTFVFALIFVFAYAVGSLAGLIGLCLAAAIVYPLQAATLSRRAARLTGGSMGAFLRPLARPFACALGMAALVTACRPLLGTLPDLPRLLVLVAVGIMAYSAAILVFDPALPRELRSLLRKSGAR